jgi:two-component system, OmpR family, phosphate regulon sensor histidine kinase PhoR
MNLRFRSQLLVMLVVLVSFFAAVQGILLRSFNASFLFASLIALFFALGLGYFLSKILLRPLREMTGLARQYASDSKPPVVYSKDEVANLKRAIVEMGGQLESRIEDISQEKDQLQAVLRGMIEGVLVVDEKGRIRMVNEALGNLFALPSPVADKVPLEVIRNAQLESSIRNVLRAGENSAFEMDLSGVERKVLDVNVVPIFRTPGEGDAHRLVMGAIAVFHDITRLKQLEKVRQDFVANVSHELRTPLTTIKGYAETLHAGAIKEDVAPRFIEIIKRHTDRLTKIVEDLLTLSTIESKEFSLTLETISISELFDDVLDFLIEPAGKKGISITRSELASPLLVHGDRKHLEQVFINLLDNAIKYGREGGRISVSAVEREGKEVQITVHDDGMGIPKQDLSRIFERFYRVDKGRSQELGGTGLGLSIVKHIVQAHGGRVWAESEPAKGSTFYFTLPMQTEAH